MTPTTRTRSRWIRRDRTPVPARTGVRGAALPPARPSGEGGAVAALELDRDAPDARIDSEPDWEALQPTGWYSRRGRRLFDLALLVLFGPPALVLGLGVAAINLALFRSFEKVFFFQPRVGHRGRLFRIVKFRTMSEVHAADYDSWESGQDRLRVTRFGRFLRNTHLDELPQLFNVLRGEMAFVGPRPEMTEIEVWAASKIEGFTTRLAVPPGITGYAQVTQGYTGNDVEAYREKFRVADWYRRSQCLRLDLAVIARTLVWMARGRGWQWNRRSGTRRVELPE
jgi:lipopolysaccharide/colanic/teichoic acid biosynthesis glycosyltransferase